MGGAKKIYKSIEEWKKVTKKISPLKFLAPPPPPTLDFCDPTMNFPPDCTLIIVMTPPLKNEGNGTPQPN